MQEEFKPTQESNKKWKWVKRISVNSVTQDTIVAEHVYRIGGSEPKIRGARSYCHLSESCYRRWGGGVIRDCDISHTATK